MRKRREKGAFWEALEKRFEIDADMMRGGERVEIRGRRRVEVEGVNKILSYSDECVRLQLARGSIRIEGCRLECVFYREKEAAVEGKINSVNFED